MTTIKLDVELRPAHVLGKRHSTILDPRKRYPASGGMSFGTSTAREALARLDAYVASCESAHESPAAPAV